MANEFNITIRGELNNGNDKDVFDPGPYRLDQAAIGGHSPIAIVGQAAEEDFATGDISTPGVMFLHNLDATNFVTYGPKSGAAMVAMCKLLPGDVHKIQLASGVTMRWQADTADCKVKVWLKEA